MEEEKTLVKRKVGRSWRDVCLKLDLLDEIRAREEAEEKNIE